MWRNARAPRVQRWLIYDSDNFGFMMRRLYLCETLQFLVRLCARRSFCTSVGVWVLRAHEKQQGNKERAQPSKQRRWKHVFETRPSLRKKVITSFAVRTWRVHICGPTVSRATDGGNATELLNMYSKNYLGHNGS
jgi:hypothetical protein